MASCLSGGGRAYRLELDIIKSPSTSWISNSPSPSSTLSESSNSQIAISTRKPRTPRKRPNETYNEAAALLSTVYPKLFSRKHLTKPSKFTKQRYPFTYDSSDSDILLPFQEMQNPSFLIHPSMLQQPLHPADRKSANSCEKPCLSPGEINSSGNSMEFGDKFDKDFDAESILDEEIEEGIDSILGNLSFENESNVDESNALSNSSEVGTCCYGYPVGLGYEVDDFGYGFGMRNYIRAFRNFDERDWWGFNSVDIGDIMPKFHKPPAEKKKKKRVEKPAESKSCEPAVKLNSSSQKKGVKETPAQKERVKEEPNPKPNVGLLLTLDYDAVLNAWSDRHSPFSGDSPATEAVGSGVQARLAAIDLFSENGGVRGASVLRYKEKRRTRLFSKKIRYQVRKVNADRRPRMKGRFVRRPNSPNCEPG